MAEKIDKNLKALENTSKKTLTLVKGTTLETDNSIRTIVNKFTDDVSSNFGKTVQGSLVNYWTEVSVRDIFSNVIPSEEKKKYTSYKDYMEKEGFNIVNGIIDGNRDLKNRIDNYRAIANYIPECARAKEILKTNIISPDDYTKKSINVVLENSTNTKEDEILKKTDHIIKKYELENLVDDIIDSLLVDSVSVLAVQSLDEEFIKIYNDIKNNDMLTEDINGRKVPMSDVKRDQLLIETLRQVDESRRDLKITKPDLKEILTENDYKVLSEGIDFNLEKGKTPSKNLNDSIDEFLLNFINENVIIGTPKEKLIESTELKLKVIDDLTTTDIITKRGPGRPRKNEVTAKSLGLFGSIITKLKAENVIEIKKDNMIYGYYELEIVDNQDYFSTSERLNKISPPGSLTFTNQVDISDPDKKTTTSESTAKNIASILARAIAKKLDSKFLQKNEQFKMQIYEILKDSDIGKKDKLKITFYDTNEIVMWKTESIYKKVEFFAKLYLAILINNILLSLGRSHDKRVFYVNMGLDKNYEQAIQNVIRDIKTKEIKSDDFADIDTILQLNPGLFHDYLIPMINGEKSIDIETIPGMNQNVNTEFTEWLKDAILNGLPVPKTIIDAAAEVEFSRSVAAQNGMFCRTIINYQREISPGFTKLMKLLYRNEYYDEQTVDQDIEHINIRFPSPLSLNMVNIQEMFAVAEQVASSIVDTLVPFDDDESQVKKILLKSEVVKDYVAIVDWDKYKKYLENITEDSIRKKIEDRSLKKQQPSMDQGDMDPYADPFGGKY